VHDRPRPAAKIPPPPPIAAARASCGLSTGSSSGAAVHHHRQTSIVSRCGTPATVHTAKSQDGDATEVARIAKLIGRQVAPSRAFWQQQAERALMNHMFREAALPPDNRLVVTRLSDDVVLLAREWTPK
jgi:hypothetical protein